MPPDGGRRQPGQRVHRASDQLHQFGPACQACLLNVLAKLRVPPDPARGLREPLTGALEFVYLPGVDRIHAASRPELAPVLEALVEAQLWVKEGPPAASIRSRLIDNLARFGLDEATRSRFDLNSYRQGGCNCLQVVVASPPVAAPAPTLYLDVDIDLGNRCGT